jgi:hypothetical protein
MARRVATRVLSAAAIAVICVLVAIALPMYTCSTGNLEFYGGEPVCIVSDLGYRPTTGLPTKITVAIGGAVIALAILLWRRSPLISTGIVIAFAAVAAPWFIDDGYEQTMRNGRPVCCGREISRERLRTGIVVVGSLTGAVLTAIGFVRARRRDIRAPTVQA